MAFANNPKYQKAYELYSSLIGIDKDAVKKLRTISPLIARIEPEDFLKIGLILDEKLIDALLTKF